MVEYIDTKEIRPSRERPDLLFLNIIRDNGEGIRIVATTSERPVSLELGIKYYPVKFGDNLERARKVFGPINSMFDYDRAIEAADRK